MEPSGTTSEANAPCLQPLPPPQQLAGDTVAGFTLPQNHTPKMLVFMYSPDEWEEFVYEWARELTADYVDVARLGGTGDEGLDIFGALSTEGLRGEWDCFQCKHYDRDLIRSDAFVEILKLLDGVVNGSYCLPRKYRFVSPRGVKTTLERLLNDPQKLREEFLAYIDRLLPRSLQRYEQNIGRIRELAREEVDFGIFKSLKFEDLLETHRRSPNHARRFGLPLPARPTPELPPSDVTDAEFLYVNRLLEVYDEETGGVIRSLEDLREENRLAGHLHRQRVCFYYAEALRVFARDQVPSGVFESLQDEIYYSVVEQEQANHESGMRRLTAVLDAAGRVQITSNMLIQVTRVQDRHGMCHQLSNQDRLRWTR